MLSNTQVILLSPTYFGEFITCNIFKTTQNFVLKFSASTQFMIFILLKCFQNYQVYLWI